MPLVLFGRLSGGYRDVLSHAGLIIALVAAPLLFCLAKAAYNLHVHPLRKYPGPFLARATRFWYIYHFWRGSLALAVRVAHKNYGEVIRISPSDLSYTNPQAWRDIYGHRHGEEENVKDHRLHIQDSPHNHILFANRENHAILRRLLSNGFSDKVLREQEPVISRYIDLLMKRLHERCNNGQQPLNIVDWYNFASFDIVGQLAFSEPFGCLSGSDYHPWVRMIFETIRVGAIFISINRIGVLTGTLKRILVPKQRRDVRIQNHELVHQKLLRRLEIKPAYTDLMQNMVRAYEAGKLKLDTLAANSRVLIIAGSETTASLLSGATYFLGKNPSTMTRLTAEVRESFESEDEINFTSVSELPYLMAVLDESLRMFPPVAGNLVRVTPPKGAMICGEWVPGNMCVGITLLAMGYSERNWREAENFHPERFLHAGGGHQDLRVKKLGNKRFVEPDSGKWANDKREALQPFSYGPRNCIGRNLAYMEMRLILARMVWNFDIELEPGSPDYPKQRVFQVWEKSPLMIRLRPARR